MHDLVHDLARSVVGNHECLIVENAHDIDYISEEARRLNLLVDLDDKEMLPKVLEALKKATKLRTIFVNKQRIGFDIGNALKENKRLRVLDMSGSDVTTESISSSIGGLKHLRYLDVHGACFPKGMIGRLSFLQTLTEFNLDEKKKTMNAGGGIEALEGLNLLTGDLRISHLENVTSGTDAYRANLKEKKNLRGLNLTWLGRHYHHGNNNHEVVLEGLRPHPNLTTLEIDGFEGSKLPRWMGDSSCLPNLVGLTLDRGIYIRQVAGFGALPSLRSLTLRSIGSMGCLGSEFYYSNSNSNSNSNSIATTTTIAFPSLKKLILVQMDSLKEWVVPVPPPQASTNNCFPLLEEIEIKYCPRLSTITPTTTIFPSLKVLYLRNIDGRAAVETLVTNNLNSLTSLRLTEISNLISLPSQGLMGNNNTLLSLSIECCYKFQGFFPPPNKDDEDDDQLQISSSCSSSSSSLQSLKLYDCPALRSYPNIRSLTSLTTLKIIGCKESKSLLDELTCLSSSSSSSLEHLEYVKVLKNTTSTAKEDVVFEWRKSEFF